MLKFSRRELECIIQQQGLDPRRYHSKKQLREAIVLLRGTTYPSFSQLLRKPRKMVEAYALRLQMSLAGYRSKLEICQAIAVMLQEPVLPLPTGYLRKSLLGNGACGSVYLVSTPSSKKDLAVKVVKSQSYPSAGALIEADILLHGRHPNIARASQAGWLQDPSYFYTVQEVADQDLFSWLEDKHTFEERLQIFAGLIDGVRFLHRHRILHADLKPENILLRDGRPMLVDFNLSERLYGQKLTTLIVTSQWRAPEIFNEQPHTLALDIWSLGVLLWDLFGPGDKLFTRYDTYDQICEFRGSQVKLRNLPEGEPRRELQRLASRCLAWKPEQRPTAEELTRSPLFRGYSWQEGSWGGPKQLLHEPDRRLPILYAWLHLLTQRTKQHSLSLTLSIDLLERYLVLAPRIPSNRLQVLGCAVHSLVTHYTEDYTYALSEYVSLANDCCTVAELAEFQREVMQLVEFQFLPAENWASSCPDAELRELITGHYAMGTLPAELRVLYQQRRFAELATHPEVSKLPPVQWRT
jgi:serine/threonine protein kinase